MNLDTGQSLGQRVTLRLRSPADLLVAVPYLIGFHPRDSVVLIGIRSGESARVEVTLRVDLPPPEGAICLALDLTGSLAARNCDAAFVIVVGGGEPEAGEPPRRDMVDALLEVGAESGLVMRDMVWAAALTEGADWRCYGGCGCSGQLPDPACSPLAAEVVAAGQVTYRDRTELEQLVAPGNEAVLARRSELLDRRVDQAARSGEPIVPSGYAALELLAHWVDKARGPLEFTDEDVVTLCIALSDSLVRDAAFGFVLGSRATEAAKLWTALVTEAPDPEAAEPAVLLAHYALTTGATALAGVALDRALRAFPGHRLGTLFRSALDAGTHPRDIRAWFSQGAEQASEALARREGPC